MNRSAECDLSRNTWTCHGHLWDMQALMDSETLGTVVSRASSGDELAFARIVAAHHADMTKVAYVICGDPELAAEAVAAAWPQAWQKLATIRDPERLRPWLVSIAVNETRQLIRKRGRRTVHELLIDVDGPSQMRAAASSDPANRAAGLDLANALRGLSEEDRTIVALRYAGGFSSPEIGRMVGLSAAGVRTRLARLLNRLRKELG